MGHIIPNKDRVGNDICLSPLEVKVPMLLADNGTDCFWFPDTMDGVSAQRMAFAMMYDIAAEVHQVDIRLIVPAASHIRAITGDLHRIRSKPLRVKLRVK